MRLRYLHGDTMTVHFGDESKGQIELTVTFTPEGEVPDAFVERLLNKYPKDYVKVEAKVDAPKPEAVECDICHKPFKGAQGVIIHKKRMHKE